MIVPMISAERNFGFLLCLCLASAFICFLVFLSNGKEEHGIYSGRNTECSPVGDETRVQEIKGLSVLGNWLLNPEGTKLPNIHPGYRNRYLILVWNYGPFLERRHIRRFTDVRHSPWTNCSVKNCELSYKFNDLPKADAVLFHLHLTKGPAELPFRGSPDQIWVFLTDESPWNSFVYRRQKLADYNGLFNWSMTYRMDSDVPVPYGRVVRSEGNSSTEGILSKKSKLAAVLISNCASRNNRWALIQELKFYLKGNLDIFGACSEIHSPCPGHFDKDCQALESYKFYLAFENSNCRDYLTEKVFWNSYEKQAVPVIYGPRKEDCNRLLPPGSFLHVEDFATTKELAHHLLFLDVHQEIYLKFHSWRNCYKVVNEHGYFGSESKHYCRLCEALNYNSRRRKVYNDLEKFWSIARDCER